MVKTCFQYGSFLLSYLFLFGLNLTIKAQYSVATFTGTGDGLSWMDPLNWDTKKIPNPKKQSVIIPANHSVFYNGSMSLDFRDSTKFKVFGNVDLGNAHLHMKENSFFLLSQHAKFIGYEIKLGQNAQGKIENNTIFKVEEIETRDNASLTINAQCVTVTRELKNIENGSINGMGCLNFTGINFINSGKGGVFNCFSSNFEDCNFLKVIRPTLSHFESRVVNNAVLLHWVSDKEPIGGYYEILTRSNNEEFESHKMIEGKGNYEYKEGFKLNFKGEIALQLHYIDPYGITSTLIDTSISNHYSEQEKKLSIYPNPSKNAISIMNLKLDEDYLLNIYSLDGILLYNTSINLQKNTLSIAQFKPGNYFVEVVNSEGVKTVLRFVKSN